jgi:hypothetical protein
MRLVSDGLIVVQQAHVTDIADLHDRPMPRTPPAASVAGLHCAPSGLARQLTRSSPKKIGKKRDYVRSNAYCKLLTPIH